MYELSTLTKYRQQNKECICNCWAYLTIRRGGSVTVEPIELYDEEESKWVVGPMRYLQVHAYWCVVW